MKLLDFCKAFSDACQIIQKWVGEDLDAPIIENGGHCPSIKIGKIDISVYDPDYYNDYESIEDDDPEFDCDRYYEYARTSSVWIYPITKYRYSGEYKGSNLIPILILADMITKGVLLNSLDEYVKYKMNK